MAIAILGAVLFAACGNDDSSECDVGSCVAPDLICGDAPGTDTMGEATAQDTLGDASLADGTPEAPPDGTSDALPDLPSEIGGDLGAEASVDTTPELPLDGRLCSDEELDLMLDCFKACPEDDHACKSACANQPPEACRHAYQALDACIAVSGCSMAALACIEAHCNDEWIAVFGDDSPADVPAPYGNASVSFATDYVRPIEQSLQEMDGIVLEASVSGVYGEAELPIQPTGANFQSYAVYYKAHPQLGDGVQAMQIAIVDGAPIDPAVLMIFPESKVKLGTIPVGLLASDEARVYVTDIDWASGGMACIHAIGVGTLEITELGDITAKGALAFEGELHLYHPTNAYDQDVSSQLGVPACEAK